MSVFAYLFFITLLLTPALVHSIVKMNHVLLVTSVYTWAVALPWWGLTTIGSRHYFGLICPTCKGRKTLAIGKRSSQCSGCGMRWTHGPFDADVFA